MKRFAIIISLLVLIVGIGCASAADLNDTASDASIAMVDYHCGVDNIEPCQSLDVEKVVSNLNSTVEDSSSDSKIISVNVSSDSEDIVAENSSVDLKGAIEISNNAPTVIKHKTLVDEDKAQSASNVFDDHPKHIYTNLKTELMKKDIAKYRKHFLENRDKIMPNGKKYSQYELILDVYKHYSFEDTVIISTWVLRDAGIRRTFTGIEADLRDMQDGSIKTYSNENNASYYKNEIQKIEEHHAYLNKEIQEFSEIFKNKNGKLFAKFKDSNIRYSYTDLILEVYSKTSNIDDAMLISAYALKNCGQNATVASIEETFNQMKSSSLDSCDDRISCYYSMMIFGIDHGWNKVHDASYNQAYNDVFNNLI